MSQETPPKAKWMLIGGIIVTVIGIGLFLLSAMYWNFEAISMEQEYQQYIEQNPGTVTFNPFIGIGDNFFIVSLMSWPLAWISGVGLGVSILSVLLLRTSSSLRVISTNRKVLITIGSSLIGGSLGGGIVLFVGIFLYGLFLNYGPIQFSIFEIVSGSLFLAFFTVPIPAIGVLLGVGTIVGVIMTNEPDDPFQEIESTVQAQLPTAIRTAAPSTLSHTVPWSVTCSSCGETNPADEKFCWKCLANLPKVERDESQSPPSIVTCSHCGEARNPHSARFCLQCGKNLPSSD